jgi:hypothetical protein
MMLTHPTHGRLVTLGLIGMAKARGGFGQPGVRWQTQGSINEPARSA